MTSRHMVCPINCARSIIILSRVSATLQQWRRSSKVASQMGYSALRPKQEEVILDFVRWSDIFVRLATGSGKLLLQLATRRVRRDTMLAGRIHCNRGQRTCCADERPGEGHDREEHPRRLRRRCWRRCYG